MWVQQIQEIQAGNVKTLARAISLVENDTQEGDLILQHLPQNQTPIIGITGPPGAGKSTLVDALISCMISKNKKVGVICIDPTSPYHSGALLGDRIRMSKWYNHSNVFIRSLGARGSLGGLHPNIIEICDLMRVGDFDLIVIETVGVGQNEVEIAGLADVTVVVLVPEAGDDIQNMKAGLMEVADIFVVNKADRPGADLFINNLKNMLTQECTGNKRHIPVIKSIASANEGIVELYVEIEKAIEINLHEDRRLWLYAERAYHLIQKIKMKDIHKSEIRDKIKSEGSNFNLYKYIASFK